jgi:hypothetical protein
MSTKCISDQILKKKLVLTNLRHVTRCTVKKFGPFLKFNLEEEIDFKPKNREKWPKIVGLLVRYFDIWSGRR